MCSDISRVSQPLNGAFEGALRQAEDVRKCVVLSLVGSGRDHCSGRRLAAHCACRRGHLSLPRTDVSAWGSAGDTHAVRANSSDRDEVRLHPTGLTRNLHVPRIEQG
jgi:hypothetical protein